MTQDLGTRRSLDLDRSVVALGVALLATAVVLSTFYSRLENDLDWSNYVVGLLATLGLLGIAGAGLVLARGADTTTDLVAWPGAFGAVGAGLMIGVALDDAEAAVYVAGLAVVALAAAGFTLTRRGPFVVAAVLGVWAVYLQAADDLIGTGDGDEVPGIKIALALTLFAVLVTVATWFLPESRVLGGAVAGAVTVVGFAALTGVLAINQAFTAAFAMSFDDYEGSDFGGELDGSFYGGADKPDGFTDDGWTILVLAVLLMLGWAACAALSRHVAYRILVVAMAVSVTPLVTRVLLVEHPTWWGVVTAALGGVALVAVGLRSLPPRSGHPTPPPAGPPPAYPAEHTQPIQAAPTGLAGPHPPTAPYPTQPPPSSPPTQP